MKNLLVILLFPILLVSAISKAQIGIGTSRPDASALLDLSSTTKGFLLPRLSLLQQQALVNPAVGLMVYNTTNGAVETNIGNGDNSAVSGGYDNQAPSYGECVGGISGTNYVPASILGFSSTDRIFNVGNGTNPGNKSDAIIIL